MFFLSAVDLGEYDILEIHECVRKPIVDRLIINVLG